MVAGHLIGDWQTGRMGVKPGERTSGEDESTGLWWQAKCEQKEIERDVFMRRLEVSVFDESPVGAASRW